MVKADIVQTSSARVLFFVRKITNIFISPKETNRDNIINVRTLVFLNIKKPCCTSAIDSSFISSEIGFFTSIFYS